MKFAEWLNAQQLRQDPIGDLARAPGMNNDHTVVPRRKPDEHKLWADIVIKSARPSQIAVFNAAWQEFLLAKEVTRESLDKSGFPEHAHDSRIFS
jgi:hypothetical protein